MTFTAHYNRYGAAMVEECDTLDEAVAFLAMGWEAGDLSQSHVADADGAVVLDGAPLFQQMKARIGA